MMFESFNYQNDFYLYYIDCEIIHYKRNILIDLFNKSSYYGYYNSNEYNYYMNLIKTYAKYINIRY